MDQFYIYYLICFLANIMIIKYRISIAHKLKLLDRPNIRKSHKFPIPSIGFMLFIPMIILSLFNLYIEGNLKGKISILLFFTSVLFSIVGYIDDRSPLSGKFKFFLISIALLIILPLEKSFIVNYLIFAGTDYVILLNQAALFFTVFCIFFFYNSLNFADGLNGICLSLCLFWISYIMIFSGLNIFYFIIFVSLIFTIIPNLFGKLFIGNTGVNFLSIIFSMIFIDLYNKNFLKFDEIIILTIFPCIDTIRVSIERLINKKSPFEPDKNHLHHLMIKFTNQSIVFIPYIIVCALPIILFQIGINSFVVIFLSILFYLILLSSLKK